MNNCELYKSISVDILNLLESNNLEALEDLMSKREKILKEEEHNKEFKKTLINEGILDIDLNIKDLLSKNIEKVKEEIREHKLSQKASSSYINIVNQKINIFNTKV